MDQNIKQSNIKNYDSKILIDWSKLKWTLQNI
jgi:hypothetical protein